MGARKNYSLKGRCEPAPFLVMAGPDEDWGFEVEALQMIPCFDLNMLEDTFEAIWFFREGDTVWGVYIWNKIRQEYEFLPPEKLYRDRK